MGKKIGNQGWSTWTNDRKDKRIEQVDCDLKERGLKRISEYKDGKSPIACKVKDEGYYVSIRYNSINKLTGLRLFNSRNPFHIHNIKLLLSKQKRRINVISKSENNRIILECQVCNHIWETSCGVVSRGSGCPKCANVARRKTTNDKILESQERLPDGFKAIRIINKQKGYSVDVLCEKHGEEFSVDRSRLDNAKCKQCVIDEKFNMAKQEVGKYGLYLCRHGYETDQSNVVVRDVEHGFLAITNVRALKTNKTKPEFITKNNKFLKFNIGVFFRVENINDITYMGHYYDEGDNLRITCKCKIDGHVWNTHYSTLKRGGRCPKCAGKLRLTTKEVVRRSIGTHGDRYSYDKTLYVNSKTKICITCKIHGDFYQLASAHIRGSNCPRCSKSIRPSVSEFVELASLKHDNAYDYSLIGEVVDDKVKIICPNHGLFIQNYSKHLSGAGCPKCANKNVTTEEFVAKAIDVHGYKYDYSDSEYIKASQKLKIRCEKHGCFWQSPNNHLRGKGCPICNESNLERIVRVTLSKMKIAFESQKKFDDLLGTGNGHLSYDFYIEDYDILIECQGRHHEESVEYFGGEAQLSIQQEHDRRKREYAIQKGYKFIEIWHWEKENITKILTEALL